jgi:MFS family permease
MLRARQPDAGSGSQRIAIACAAFCMQLALGAVYGWSVFLNPLREHFGASKVEVGLTFTITLAVLGITAGFGGSLQRRIGPRATASVAGLLYGSGVLLSGLAPNLCLISLFNGLGRLFWGTLSDRIGRTSTFMALFLLQTAAFALLPASGHFTAFLVPVAIIALCYGGGFGTMPAFATDVFGAKNAGAIYGAMLTAWSAGAIAGPLLIAAVPYRTALPLIAAVLATATGLPLVFRALVQANNPVCTKTAQSGVRRPAWPYMR